MIGGILVLLLLLGLILVGNRRGEKTEKKAGIGRLTGWPEPAVRYWLKKARLLNRPADREAREALLLDGDSIPDGRVRAVSLVLGVIALGAVLSVALGISEGKTEPVKELQRPDFGEERELELEVQRGGLKEKILVTVSGREPAEEELSALFDEIFEAACPEILNGNASFSEVRTDLATPSGTENGIVFRFSSSDPMTLSDFGTVMADDLPPEGRAVTFTMEICYKDVSKPYEMDLCVLPAEKAALAPAEEIDELIREADGKTLNDGTLVLPAEYRGEALVFLKEGTSPYLFLALACAAAACLLFLPKEKRKARLRKRTEELEADYPALVSKLSTLIHAGLSIRGAWNRVVNDYERGRTEKNKPRRFAYEEMKAASNRMSSGESEEAAYISFGRRCGPHAYVRLGTMLSKNLRQGIAGLEVSLEEEVAAAFEEKKNRALKRGEEAGTKLLLPMFLMLTVVIVTLVVPAFMSF